MCATCGCSEDRHEHHHHPDHDHEHHGHAHAGAPDVHAHMPPHVHALEEAILGKNDLIAEKTRRLLLEQDIVALNLVSSPGAGKTTLLERTISDLRGEVPIQVIEGDQATAQDADRIRAAGATAIQVNTGTGCHLDAAMVERALGELDTRAGTLLLIENVGNLVCPALFDLGERAKVLVASVTEGEDKPIKYPHMFRASQVVLLNKVDLIPHVRFDVDRFAAYAKQVNSELEVVPVSAVSGEGLDLWYSWIKNTNVRS